MTSCKRYQADLLEYLYDLLEEDEQRTLRGHLEFCPACREELARARSQQHLLAVAAKKEFPAVRFAVPSTGPQTIPYSGRRNRRLGWLAMAAGVLVAAGALGIWHQQFAHDTEEKVAQNQAGPKPQGDPVDVGPGPMKPLHTDPSRSGSATDPEAWGEAVDGLASVVWTDKAEFKVGEAIGVHYRVKNVAAEPRLLWDLGFWQNHQIVVRDEAGQEVSLTRRGRSLRSMFQPGKPAGLIKPSTLEPGKSVELPNQDLTALFVVNKPGKYTIRYVYEENQGQGWSGRLDSNLLTITVTK